MRGFDVRVFVIMCVFLLGGLSVAQAPTQADEYEMHWRAATNALVAFSTAEMIASEGAPGNHSQLTETYKREHDNFAREIAWISQSKPEPRQFLRQWKLIPVYDQVLSAMTIVTDAAQRNDSAAEAAGWASFRDALTELRGTIEEITHANE